MAASPLCSQGWAGRCLLVKEYDAHPSCVFYISRAELEHEWFNSKDYWGIFDPKVLGGFLLTQFKFFLSYWRHKKLLLYNTLNLQHLEAVGDLGSAVAMFERSETHRFEVLTFCYILSHLTQSLIPVIPLFSLSHCIQCMKQVCCFSSGSTATDLEYGEGTVLLYCTIV